MKRTTPLYWILIGLALSATGGCISSNQVPETRFYILNALPPAEPLRQGGGDDPVLEIASLTLPQYLERPQIVTRPSANRLDIDEFHRWGGNLRKNLSRVMATNLSRLLATPHVLVVPHLSQDPIDYRLQLEVTGFERGPGNTVRLTANWTLIDMRRNKTALVRFSDLSQSVEDPQDMDETVAAMASLLGRLSRQIAEAILAQGR